jgi:hypothetical protein
MDQKNFASRNGFAFPVIPFPYYAVFNPELQRLTDAQSTNSNFQLLCQQKLGSSGQAKLSEL